MCREFIIVLSELLWSILLHSPGEPTAVCIQIQKLCYGGKGAQSSAVNYLIPLFEFVLNAFLFLNSMFFDFILFIPLKVHGPWEEHGPNE